MFIKSLLAIALTVIISTAIVFYGAQVFTNQDGMASIKVTHPQNSKPVSNASKPVSKASKPVSKASKNENLRPKSTPDDNAIDAKTEKIVDTQPSAAVPSEPARTAPLTNNSGPNNSGPNASGPNTSTSKDANAQALKQISQQVQLDKKNAQATLGILMKQAAMISDRSLQDQAYLDIVIYALRYDIIDDAMLAMGKINQIELRETARSRIAIALAQSGKTKEAFALVNDVEIDELQDIMRLQVMESIIQPDQSPLQTQ